MLPIFFSKVERNEFMETKSEYMYFANLIFKRMAFSSLFCHKSLQPYLNLIFRSLVFTI